MCLDVALQCCVFSSNKIPRIYSVGVLHDLVGSVESASLLGQPLAPALAYAEQLACTLIANLGGGVGSGTATEGTQAPAVAALADELLFLLLEAFPALLHSQLCYCALLVQLQREEGDIPMGKVGRCAAVPCCWHSAGTVKCWSGLPQPSACVSNTQYPFNSYLLDTLLWL